jgi:cyclohexadieny/prephenate dehydrogenase
VLRQVTILAPGLIGASVARAVRARGVAPRIAVWARRPEVRIALASQPWCDTVAETPVEAVKDASLVLIASPVDRIVPLARECGPALAEGAIVTDVGSVKAEICRLAHDAVGPKARFVGAHPMAGSEKTGWEHGSAQLFENRACFVTPTGQTDPTAVKTVVQFLKELGSEVVTMDPDRHDEIVANISHLPQVLASCLCAMLAGRDPGWRNHAGGGLRDTTRIAASDPKLWRTILEQNRDEVLRALHNYQDELQAFQAALANRDYLEILSRLERGKAYRDQVRTH